MLRNPAQVEVVVEILKLVEPIKNEQERTVAHSATRHTEKDP
jgi:hypothetical protein